MNTSGVWYIWQIFSREPMVVPVVLYVVNFNLEILSPTSSSQGCHWVIVSRQPDIDHQRLCIAHIQWWQRQLICWALGCRSGQVARFWLGHAQNDHFFCLHNVPSPWPLLVLHTQDLWWPWLTYCHQFSIAYYFWSDSQASNVEHLLFWIDFPWLGFCSASMTSVRMGLPMSLWWAWLSPLLICHPFSHLQHYLLSLTAPLQLPCNVTHHATHTA